MRDETGAHGIELHVPVAGQQIGISVYGAASIPTVPGRARTLCEAIDPSRMATGQSLHQLAQIGRLGARVDDQMNVIGHQAITVQPDPGKSSKLGQRLKIGHPVIGRDEDGVTIVAPLHDVMWQMGQCDSSLAWHPCLRFCVCRTFCRSDREIEAPFCPKSAENPARVGRMA
jgi:hypothetical protein